VTFAEVVPIYLERHATGVRPRTITTLRERLGHRRQLKDDEECGCATCAFGDVPLAAGVSVFELVRVMGTSVQMIERHYGALLDGAGADITRRIVHSTRTGSRSSTVAARTFRPLSGKTRMAPAGALLR
jgi:hypothetical protein